MSDDTTPSNALTTILLLVFLLVGLLALLFFLYKKLNKEADGEYAVRRIVYKEGGVRDRLRGAVLALETRLGVQLWPAGDPDGQEMQDVSDEEGRADGGSDTGGEEEQEEEEEEEEEKSNGKADDSSSDRSGSASSEERAGLTEERKEEREAGKEEQGKEEEKGGAELLINLNQFSGSAIWSGDGGVGVTSDVTVL